MAKPPPWRRELATAIRDPAELLSFLGLPAALLPGPTGTGKGFPMLVPRSFAARMRPGDPHDPLLLQVLPQAAEDFEVPGFSSDPVGESACHATPGLLRKYQGRALLICTGACAVHCRYCFRRDFPYAQRPKGPQWWSPAIESLAQDPSIDELILSGGDPLTLPDQELAAIFADAARIPTLRRLRIHTRLPIVLPARVDEGLLTVLRQQTLPLIVVLHANHAQELNSEVAEATRALRAIGCSVFNQAVLLARVNDTAAALRDLCLRLGDLGVLPYYLHQLDRVAGSAHFLVTDATACAIIEELRASLPGYLVPKLVREVAGMSSKSPVAQP